MGPGSLQRVLGSACAEQCASYELRSEWRREWKGLECSSPEFVFLVMGNHRGEVLSRRVICSCLKKNYSGSNWM